MTSIGSSVCVFSRGNTLAAPLSISFVIPTFRRPTLIAKALNSLAEQKRAGLEFEVIVVNNASGPEFSEEYLRTVKNVDLHRIEMFENTANLGMFGNWNKCLELARGDWICLLNDDDFLLPGFLDAVKAHLVEKKYSIVGTSKIEVDNRKPGPKLLEPSLLKRIKYQLVRSTMVSVRDIYIQNCLGNSSGLLIDRRLIGASKFDEKYFPSADYHFWTKLVRMKPALIISDPLTAYVIGENESLRPEILQGFLSIDRKIRMGLRTNNSKLFSFFENYMIWRDVEIYKHKWKVDLTSYAAEIAPLNQVFIKASKYKSINKVFNLIVGLMFKIYERRT